MGKFKHLEVPNHWKHYWTQYPQGYTILEALFQWIDQVNKMSDELNNTLDRVKWVEELVDKFIEEMQDQIEGITTDILQQWYEDGTLAQIINDEVFDMKADKVDVEKLQTDMADRGVNIRLLGAVLDGVTDDFPIIQQALQDYDHILIPAGGVLGVTDTIKLNRGQSLIGMGDNTRDYGNTPIIRYIGEMDRHKTVVQVGSNNVDAEPTVDASNIIVKNLRIDANYLAGFCIYGTYLVNETQIDNLSLFKSLEYNAYFARGWYATIQNITSLACKGNGIALGMPLEYQDGTPIQWQVNAPHELNNVKIDNIRSHSAGRHYASDNPGLFDHNNPLHRRHGYGIGAGIGNGFNLSDFLSEKSGGTNLYVYTASQPVKNIRNGYLEGGAENSGMTDVQIPNMIIEHTSGLGGAYTIENIFMNYNSGGIFHIGGDRNVWLKNIHQPRFLRSIDGRSQHELASIVLKDNVYYQCGYYNDLPKSQRVIYQDIHNTRYTFVINMPPNGGARKLIYLKGTGVLPSGNLRMTFADGDVVSVSYPSLNTSTFTYLGNYAGDLIRVQRGGSADERDADVEFRIIEQPVTIV